MHLLIVEDDPVLSDGLKRSLRKHGATPSIMRILEHAQINFFAVHPFDLVILDLGLPGMNGLDVLRRMRLRRSTTPV